MRARGAGLLHTLVLYALCVGTLASALGFPVFMPATVMTLAFDGIAIGDSWLGALITAGWCALVTAGFVAIYAPAVIGARRRKLLDLRPWMILLPLYYLLISLATWAALFEYVRVPFRWNKTMHSKARTSRTGAPLIAR